MKYPDPKVTCKIRDVLSGILHYMFDQHY